MNPALSRKGGVNALVQWLVVACATGGGTSFLLARPGRRDTGTGTVGTLVGFAILPLLPSDWTFVVVVCVAIPIALLIIERARRTLNVPDDPRIVLDEIIGAWCAVLLLPRSWPYLLAAFILFRLFDVWKPGPIGASQHWPGSVGILLDDVLAGLAACGVLQVVRFTLGWMS